MTERQSLAKKIQALIAKAESSEFEAEAEIFIAKAHELMVLHQIEEHELDASNPDKPLAEIVAESFPLGNNTPYEYFKWRTVIAAGIANSFGCTFFYYTKVCRGTFVGTKAKTEAMILLYNRIIEQVELVTASAMSQAIERGDIVIPGGRGSRSPMGYRKAYLQELSATLQYRLIEARRQLDKHTTAIIISDQERIDEYVNEHYCLRQGKRDKRATNFAARLAGSHDSKRIRIHDELSD